MASDWVKWEDLEDRTRQVGDKKTIQRDGYSISVENFEPARAPVSIEDSIEEAKKAHKRIFENYRAGMDIPPTALVIDPKGLWTCVCIPEWTEMRAKGRRELHRIALENKAVCLIWGSDSYFVERDATKIKKEDLPSPNDCPDRKQAFVLTTVWPDGSAQMQMFPYRVEHDQIVWEPLGEGYPEKDSEVEQHICPPWSLGSGMVQ